MVDGEAIVTDACMVANGTLQVQWGDKAIDFTRPWKRARYGDLFKEHAGCDMRDQEAVVALAYGLESRARDRAERCAVEQHARAFVRAATDATAQLM